MSFTLILIMFITLTYYPVSQPFIGVLRAHLNSIRNVFICFYDLGTMSFTLILIMFITLTYYPVPQPFIGMLRAHLNSIRNDFICFYEFHINIDHVYYSYILPTSTTIHRGAKGTFKHHQECLCFYDLGTMSFTLTSLVFGYVFTYHPTLRGSGLLGVQ